MEQLEALQLIDWAQAVPLKLKVLRALFDQFCAQERAQLMPRALEFHHFCERNGRALEDHARHEAIQAAQLAQPDGNGHWRNWPEALRDPRSVEVDAFAEANRHEVDFHLFLQWLAAKGLSHAQHAARDAGMAIGLIADLAVGMRQRGQPRVVVSRTTCCKACRSVHHPTCSTRPARHGASRRFRRARCARRASPRSSTCCGPRSRTRVACGSITSSACGGCGSCPTANPRKTARTCAIPSTINSG